VAKIVLEHVQDMFLKIALQMAREGWETRRERQRQGMAIAKTIAGKYADRKADTATHKSIIALRTAGKTISETAELAKCSASQVKQIWAAHLKAEEAVKG
jgi:DNA invertase Pin-like site-specific DNA recombinase